MANATAGVVVVLLQITRDETRREREGAELPEKSRVHSEPVGDRPGRQGPRQAGLQSLCIHRRGSRRKEADASAEERRPDRGRRTGAGRGRGRGRDSRREDQAPVPERGKAPVRTESSGTAGAQGARGNGTDHRATRPPGLHNYEVAHISQKHCCC